MSVRVHYHPNELADAGEIEVLIEVTSYEVLDDQTIELRRSAGPGKYKVIGHVHANRWDSIVVIEEASA